MYEQVPIFLNCKISVFSGKQLQFVYLYSILLFVINTNKVTNHRNAIGGFKNENFHLYDLWIRFTGKEPPEFCPQCKAPASKFQEQKTQGLVWADEHRIGVAAGVDPEIVEGLRQNFTGECTEVGMYLAMSRQADREGYPEIAEAYKRFAFEEAEHAAKFAELLGEVVYPDTKKNVELRAVAEHGACEGKRNWLPAQKNWVWMRFMTRCMRCAKMKRGTVVLFRVC